MKHPLAKHPATWALLGVVALAAFLRLWQIERFPPGLFGDEAVNGLDALDVLAGRGAVFFPANFGREGAHIWLVAAALRLFGVTPVAVRLPSIAAGVLTVAAAAWLGREIVAARRCDMALRPLDAWLPVLIAAFTAASYWHLHFSRFGIRGIFTPLWTALAFAAFWRGVNRRRTHWFIVSGLCLGAGVHFYTASRFTPFVLIVFLLLEAALALWVRRRPGAAGHAGRDAPLVRRFWRPLLWAGLAAALVAAPLGLYFIAHPGSFTARAAAVSAFDGATAQGNPWGRIAQAAIANIVQFFAPGQGDPAAFYNLPGRAVFDPLTAALTLLGLLVCVRRRRQPIFLFLLLWPPLMLIPTFLAVDRFPTLPRALGVMPGIFVWAALGLEAMIERAFLRAGKPVLGRACRLPDRLGAAWQARLGPGLALTAALLAPGLHGGLAVRDYFGVWGPSAAAFEAFDGHETASALWLARHPQSAPVYLSADLYRHPVIMFLLEQTPLTEFFSHRNANLHWFDARQALVLPPAGQRGVYVFSGQAQAALDTWLPQRQIIHADQAPDGQPATTVIGAAAEDLSPGLAAPVIFVNGLTLTHVAVTPVPQPGATQTVSLTWQIVALPAAPTGAFKLRIALLAGEQPWAGVETPLGYRPAEWAAGERFIVWRSLALPPDAPAAAYTLAVALVDDAGQIVPLSDGAAEARLGPLLIP